jgi:hypothetical protein
LLPAWLPWASKWWSRAAPCAQNKNHQYVVAANGQLLVARNCLIEEITRAFELMK